MSVAALEHSPSVSPSIERFQRVRQFSEHLAAPLSAEDCAIQSMPDVSPTRWHLAHTTWFLENFILSRWLSDYEPYDPAFTFLFNSYYNLIGSQFPRPQRGLISRPGLDAILRYRTRWTGAWPTSSIRTARTSWRISWSSALTTSSSIRSSS